MADFWKLGAMAWCLTVLGWLLSPVIIFLVNKFLAYLFADTDISNKLRELEIHTVPSLKQALSDVEEQQMWRAAEGKGCASDLETLAKMKKDLRSALYDAEDILDLVDYHWIEKSVTGDGESHGSSWVQHLLGTAGNCVARCREICLGQWIGMTRAGLMQSMRATLQGSTAGNDSSAEDASSQENVSIAIPPRIVSSAESIPIEESVSMVQKLHAWSNDLVLYIINCCRSMFTWSISVIAAACFYRDWSYEVVGIKNNQMDATVLDSSLRAIERKGLRERIEQIEYTVTDLKKSELLDQQRSSSEIPIKDTNKETSIKILVKDKESGREQEDIDDLYRSIKQKVFGRDKVRQDICRMLREELSSSSSRCYSVIGIHGITGSGKSTLAQYICDYEKDEGNNHFNLVMFIHVSNSFRLGDIFCKMLEQMSQKHPSEDKCLKSLQKELKENLKSKRFLLVLDDLWLNNENRQKLDVLLDTLSVGGSGSRILVTAQREDAATALGAQKQISIPHLEEEEYFSLFMYHALQGTEDDGEHEKIGRMIAKRLHRSPMAAVVVAKQLQRNKSINFWETTANLDVLNETMGALWWSYQQLRGDSRRCFEYFSTFPKGYDWDRDELVRMWIAQGFVKTSNATEDMDALGQSYIQELLTFSFLQGERYIRVHDLLHELAERVSGSDSFRIDANDSQKDVPPEVRHLFIRSNNIEEVKEKILNFETLRTLIIKPDYRMILHNEGHDLAQEETVEGVVARQRAAWIFLFQNIFMRLTKLRLLIVEQACNVFYKHEMFSVRVPASIGQMKHLRYLSVKNYPGVLELVFPSTFSKLYHVHILDIPNIKLSSAGDVANFRHLQHIPGWLEVPNIGRLTSLQTVANFRVREEQGYELKQLKHLNMLRNLRIGGLKYVRSKEEALEAHLTRKERLELLELNFWGFDDCHDSTDILEGLCPPKDLKQLNICYFYQGSRYPSWMLNNDNPDSPKHLSKLELNYCIPLVSIPEDSELFVHLRELYICGGRWKALPDNMDRLMSLQELAIWNCREITHLPTLPCSLKRIEIFGVYELSTTCQETGHENWQKIQHIPTKTFWDL
ncbi:hypothetical protein ACP4OV_002346 [Aristida adscensionis]